MLEQIGSLGYGGQHLNDVLARALIELQQNICSGPTNGVSAGTLIPVVEGIDSQDTIQKVLMNNAGTLSDITSTCTIAGDKASGTITLTSGFVAGNNVAVNGKTYTSLAGVPSNTNPIVGPGQFIDGVAVAALGNAQQIGALAGLGLSYDQARTLAAVGALAIAAFSLALAINATDSQVSATSLNTSGVYTAVVTITARAEGTAGNSIALSVASAGGHASASASTLAGGAAGFAYGTVTLAAAAAADTVTIDTQTFTAVASSTVSEGEEPGVTTGATPLTKNQFIGGTVALADLMNIGLLEAQAQAILNVSNDAAAATILAHQINDNDGARVTANNGLPVGPDGVINYGALSLAQAGQATAVVTVTADFTGAAANTMPLTSSNGTRLAVTGSGTLTAASHGITSSTNTSGNQVLVWFWKKSRVVGQA